MTGQDVAFPASPSIAVAEDLPPSIVAEVPTGLLLGVAESLGAAYISSGFLIVVAIVITAIMRLPPSSLQPVQALPERVLVFQLLRQRAASR